MKTVDGVRQLRLKGQPIANILPLTGARTPVGGLVIDRTGLSGTFDVDLDYVPQSSIMAATGAAPSGPSLVTAFQDQLGLKFERRKDMMDVVVIDHVEKPAAD